MKSIVIIVIALLFPYTVFSQGVIIKESFFSESLQAEKEYNIYLPDGYDTSQEEYQVIYFLHGMSTDHNTYLVGGIVKALLDLNISNGSIHPTIFVLPDGSCPPYGGSFYTNSVLYGDYEDYIVYDLIEHIDENYRTFSDKNKRCIMGHSMGGYGSMKLALKHTDIFLGVASLSGPLDLNHFENRTETILNENGGSPPYEYHPDDSKFSTYAMFTMAGAFSPNMDNPPYYVDLPLDENGDQVDSVMKKFMDHNPACYVKDLAQNQDLRIFFDCGRQDELGLYELNLGFRDSLAKYQIEYIFQEFDGLHSSNLIERIPNALRYCDSIMNLTTDIAEISKKRFEVVCAPNPFSEYSVISFQLSVAEHVKIDVYNSLGDKINTMVDGYKDAGEHRVVFSAEGLAAGMYYLVTDISGRTEVIKTVVVR